MTEVSNVTNTVLTTLDIGSGIDSVKLARDLTDAVQIPAENRIQKKIDYADTSISAYGLVKFQIDTMKGSFEKLNDANELATSTGTSSDLTKMTVSSVAGTASTGAYDFTISQLAQNQRVISDQYTSNTQSLNGGSAFDISLAVGTTKSAVTAVYNATATASETTTLVVGDGTNTVSVASATYASIAAQVSAIQGASGYGDLLFTVAVNADADGIAFTYKTAGSVASTPTFTGSGSTHTITNPTVGVSVATPVSGVAAEYNVTGTASETTTLVVSDGSTTVSLDSATYTSIAEQVSAIQAATGYDNLKFTVSANSGNDGFKFTYKTTGAVTTAPTLTGSGSSHTVTTTTAGVTPVNSATTTSIAVDTDTPAGVVSAINAANTGVQATLVDTGTGTNTFRIVLSGQTGSDGVFTLTSSPDLGFHDTANTLQSAQDSIIEFEGLSITRSSNNLTDVIEGATINLMATTASNVRIDIANDKSTLKSAIQDVVKNYNDFLGLLDELTATPEDDATGDMVGALVEDTSLVRFLKNKVKDAVFADSSTPSGSITALRDIGLSVNQYGDVTFDEAVYDSAVLSSYDDIVTMLTADTSNENLFADTNKGLAQDIATTLGDFTDSEGVVTNREAGAKTDLTEHQDELLKLEARMEVVYNRYLTQFAAMETLMAQLDSTKDYLTSQFETLAKAYDDP
jgi:flagellar hook-associated protein 2